MKLSSPNLNLKTFLFLQCLIFFNFIPCILSAQGMQPFAMVLPVKYEGIDDSGTRKSLENFIETELSKLFLLKSRAEVQEAIQKAAEEVDSSNCDDDACVKKMGELLDVEYTFTFEVTKTSEGWDLSAKRMKIDDVTSRRNELCKECELSKARNIVREMILGLSPGESRIKIGQAVIKFRSTPKATIFYKGVKQGNTPIDVTVPSREVFDVFAVAVEDGYEDFKRDYGPLKAGQVIQENIKLAKKRSTLKVESTPPNAVIAFDGVKQKSRTPTTFRVLYGEYDLTISLKNYYKYRKSILINKKEQKISAKLNPLPATLLIRAPDEHKNARVFLNGKDSGSMDGKTRSIEIPSNQEMTVKLVEGKLSSDIKKIKINPGSNKTINFESFAIKNVNVQINVPYEFSRSLIFINEKYIGRMGGGRSKRFQVEYAEELEIYAAYDDRESKEVTIEPVPNQISYVTLEFPEPLIDWEKMKSRWNNLFSGTGSKGATHEIGVIMDNMYINLKSDSSEFIGYIASGGLQYGLELEFDYYNTFFKGGNKFYLSYSGGSGNVSKYECSGNSGCQFYFVENQTAYKVTNISFENYRFGFAPGHGKNSNWYYAIAWELGTLTFTTSPPSSRKTKFQALLLDGGYRWEIGTNWFLDLGWRARTPAYSKTTDLGGGWIFNTGIRF